VYDHIIQISLLPGWLFISFRCVFDAALIVNYEINADVISLPNARKCFAANSKSQSKQQNHPRRANDAARKQRPRLP